MRARLDRTDLARLVKIHPDVLHLADPIGAVRSFRLRRRIPPSSVMHHMVRLDNREPDARHERRQDEDVKSWFRAEFMQDAVSGLDARRLQRTGPQFRFAIDVANRKVEFL